MYFGYMSSFVCVFFYFLLSVYCPSIHLDFQLTSLKSLSKLLSNFMWNLLGLGINQSGSLLIKVAQNFLWQDQICYPVPVCLYGENVEKSFFSKCIKN